ncbi:MAG: alpha/beta hydrolase [Methanobrevibacter sp.]|jgi:acetyl esterase/lipase|nr:alpha/beta hydrolase [Candidatus Methanoflexus mossambicus]
MLSLILFNILLILIILLIIFILYCYFIKRISVLSYLVYLFFKFFGSLKTIEKNKKAIKKEETNNEIKIPKLNNPHFCINDYNHPILKIGGRKAEKVNKDTIIIYLHGGGYTAKPLPFHYTFCDKLVSKFNYIVYMPLCPRAPKYSYKEVFNYLDEVYNELSKEYEHIILAGDSAGGGMAQALCQYINEKEYKQVDKLILIAPWLDVSMSDYEDIDLLEKTDPRFSVLGMRYHGQFYSKGDDNYFVNPLHHGKIHNLPKTLLLVSNTELLYKQSVLLKKEYDKNNLDMKIIDYKNMFHCFPLAYPYLYESRKAFKEIVEFIEE